MNVKTWSCDSNRNSSMTREFCAHQTMTDANSDSIYFKRSAICSYKFMGILFITTQVYCLKDLRSIFMLTDLIFVPVQLVEETYKNELLI